MLRKKDDEKFSLSSKYIRNSIISKIQNNSNYDSYLRKEFGKNRHQSLRMIFKQLSNYLTTLTPCILFNPLSVTSYFDIKDRIFDVVIFDEASQIEICEVIGVIAKCK
jgi:superfamily I DNA and/or RNA helicase